jgi:hypothetical protein
MNKITPPAAPFPSAVSIPAPSPAPVFKALAAAGLIAPFLSHGAIITVGTTDAENATVCTLRDAGRAVSSPGVVFGGCAPASVGATNEIRFGANVVGTITYSDASNVASLAGAEFLPLNDLTITGPGASTLAGTCAPNTIAGVMFIAPSANAVSSVGISVSGLTFRDCVASDAYSGFPIAAGLNAGSVFVSGNVASNVTLSNIVATGNRGAVGGILAATQNGSLQATRMSVENNLGLLVGGAAFLSAGDSIVRDSTFSGNTGGGVSGVYVEARGGDVSVDNTTVSGNAVFSGSGVGITPAAAAFLADGDVGISHSTIVRNTAINVSSAVGLLAGFLPSSGTASSSAKSARIGGKALSVPAGLNNSIVCGNDIADVQGNVIANFNLLGVTAPGSLYSGVGNVTGCTGAQLNNWLGPLANNGGPTRTHALINVAGNPAINSGDPGFSGAPTDQTGLNPRAAGRTDMGAFELVGAAAEPSSVAVPTAGAAGLGALSIALAALGMRRRKARKEG